MRLTEAEWVIMNALWEGHPARAREIAGRLPADVNWAYTTIKTLLTRLVEKKAVQERKEGNASVYEPLLSRRNAQRSALRALAEQAFDGAFGPLMHFLLEQERLTAKQRRELIRILENNRKAKGERK
ncbi:MAG TPA: BlaI/MecI/CopY family transcriptional regulator [Sedimentisphaerales bacterium]|nr:BlaI/MecI/CopY family transcriptional regulator [Sedimentisphaerales bacterium]